MDGDKSVPEQDSFIERTGERWKVVLVNEEASVSEPFQATFMGFSSPTSCDLSRGRRSVESL